jgi:hypothetical protein
MAEDNPLREFVKTTLETLEALSQRVKALEDRFQAMLDLIEHSENRTWDAFEKVTDTIKTLGEAIIVGKRSHL